ncbi:MAG: aromatic ring-hydroxylating dioxygenase subunit alpha [Gammaproteobacteria bacterium]|nr:aromatic ring-hydroxylating dioxygenase subunit alpha [Gammaproteobacteria bacterium]
MLLINNWYVAGVAAELGDDPERVTMLGCDFVLFRDADARIHCLSDLCVHRGASLSVGECKNGGIMCPQHGWEFSGDGRCRLIPAGTKTPTEPPKRARVPAYPVAEKYGLIFVFLGDLGEDARPAVPDIMPEWDSGDWHKGVITRRKDINYLRMAENYNDPCHVHYIHEFAKWLPKGVTIIDHELTDRYVRAWHAAWDAQGNFGESSGLMMEYDVISCVSRNTNYQPEYPSQIVTAYVTPIDARNTQIHMVILMPKGETTSLDGSTVRGATAEEHEMMVNMTRDTVMDEDYAVLQTTRPRQAASTTEELLVDTDRTLVQVRQMTLDYGQKHGGIDTAALSELEDTHIRVIPCPGHKSDPKNWVHKTVPLLHGTGRGKLQAAS